MTDTHGFPGWVGIKSSSHCGVSTLPASKDHPYSLLPSTSVFQASSDGYVLQLPPLLLLFRVHEVHHPAEHLPSQIHCSLGNLSHIWTSATSGKPFNHPRKNGQSWLPPQAQDRALPPGECHLGRHCAGDSVICPTWLSGPADRRRCTGDQLTSHPCSEIISCPDNDRTGETDSKAFKDLSCDICPETYSSLNQILLTLGASW